MSKPKISLQLYTVRDDMAQDFEGTLKKVKEIGYDFVEFAGYYGHSASQVKELLDKYGLECVSVHQGYEVFVQDEKANVDFLAGIGAKYCAVPWMDKAKHKGSPAFEKTVEDFTQVAKALKSAGITLLYHNHDFEFERFEGKFLLDWLYESLPSELLQTEIDTCWVRYAGYNPVDYIAKYSGRSPVVHLKDFVCTKLADGPAYALIDDSGNEIKNTNKEDNGFMFKPVGHGIQDIPAILKASEAAGALYAVVEQDASPERPALEAARMSREYLKTLGY